MIHVDIDKATQKGVSVNNAMTTLQTLLGSEYATNFIKFGQMYKVMVQALPEYRAKPEDILNLYVKNDKDEMVPYAAFTSVERVYGVDDITRFNMYPSAEVSGDAAQGFSSGSAIKAIQETAKEKLPKGYDIDWAGISRDEVNQGDEAVCVFLILQLFAYLLLSAQYENFLLPMPVILSLPTGIFGAYSFLLALGLENNIYAQIALIMLIGLLGKNAILIVEFATMKHREGKRPLEAAIEGAKIRLRPILNRYCLKNNLDVLMAEQKIEIARANVKYSKGLAYPAISAFGTAGQQKFGDYTMNAAGNRGTTIYKNQQVQDFSLGFESSWEVDFWGKLRNTRKSAVAQFLSSVEGKNWTVTNLVSEVASGYYELLALDNELDIVKESVQLQDSALHVVNIQRQVGVVNELAVKQFEAQVLNSKKMEIDIRQKISEAENRLNFILGLYPQPIERNKSALLHLVPPQVRVGIPSNLLANRPDVKQAEYDLLSSKANVKVAKAAFYPTCTISGSITNDAFKTSLLFSPESFAYTVVGNLVAPIINRSALKAQFKTANAIQIEALYNYQKSILNSYMEVYNQMVNLKSVGKALELKSKEVNTLNLAVNSSNQLFKTGRANYLEVLTVQANVLQSKIELVETMKDQYTSVVAIYKALGGGWK